MIKISNGHKQVLNDPRMKLVQNSLMDTNSHLNDLSQIIQNISQSYVSLAPQFDGIRNIVSLNEELLSRYKSQHANISEASDSIRVIAERAAKDVNNIMGKEILDSYKAIMKSFETQIKPYEVALKSMQENNLFNHFKITDSPISESSKIDIDYFNKSMIDIQHTLNKNDIPVDETAENIFEETISVIENVGIVEKSDINSKNINILIKVSHKPENKTSVRLSLVLLILGLIVTVFDDEINNYLMDKYGELEKLITQESDTQKSTFKDEEK